MKKLTLCLSLGALLSVACGVLTPALAGVIPDNARASEFGGGWDCVWGYRRVGESCAAVRAPVDGYIESSGTRWECKRGFAKVEQQRCVKIKLPANAHLSDSWLDRNWQCDRGYHVVGEVCATTTVPSNAYLTDSSFGRQWECERGFHVVGERCAAVKIPPNGYLATAGDDWKCERGFFKQGESCLAVAVPANAYLDTGGDAWLCEHGFQRVASACVQLNIPPNGYVDYTGNAWRCIDGFHRQKDACVSEEGHARSLQAVRDGYGQ
jgi:hypothetical protein